MAGKSRVSIRDELMAAAYAAKIPLKAHLELTKRCWLDCIHCYVDHDAAKNELTTSEWIAILKDLADWGTFFVTFTGGDPFLRRDFFDIAQAAHEFGFHISILSSWFRSDRALIKRLSELRVYRLSFSFYGIRPETHEAITRMPGSFEKLRQALNWAVEFELPVQPKFLIMKHNWKELRGFFEEIVDSIPRPHLVKPGVDFQLFESFSPKRNPTELRISLDELLELFRDEFILKRIYPEDLMQETASWLSRATASRNDTPCTIGHTSIAIDSLGFVYPCEMWPRPLGNVRDHGLRWLWTESDEIKLVRSITVGDLKDCQSCELAPFCHACMAYSVYEHGDWRRCSTNARMWAALSKELRTKFYLNLPRTDSNRHDD